MKYVTIKTIIDIYNNLILDFTADAKKYFIKIKIGNQYKKFKVDTGAE